MKTAFDPNYLTSILVKGFRTEHDNRHAFWYENLLKAFHEAGIKIDEDKLWEESNRRYDKSSKRSKYKRAPLPDVYSFTFTADIDLHWELTTKTPNDRFPSHAQQKQTDFSDEPGMDLFHYYTRGKYGAAELWKWIKKYHPDHKDLKIIKS